MVKEQYEQEEDSLYSNENMDEIIEIIESLENSSLLTNGGPKKVEREIKKTRRWISSCYCSTYGCFIDSIYGFCIDITCSFYIESSINAISGRGFKKAGKRQGAGFLPLLAAPLILKAMSGGGYNKMDHMNKNF